MIQIICSIGIGVTVIVFGGPVGCFGGLTMAASGVCTAYSTYLAYRSQKLQSEMNGRIIELEGDAALIAEAERCMKLKLEECNELRRKIHDGENVTPGEVSSLLESIESVLEP